MAKSTPNKGGLKKVVIMAEAKKTAAPVELPPAAQPARSLASAARGLLAKLPPESGQEVHDIGSQVEQTQDAQMRYAAIPVRELPNIVSTLHTLVALLQDYNHEFTEHEFSQVANAEAALENARILE